MHSLITNVRQLQEEGKSNEEEDSKLVGRLHLTGCSDMIACKWDSGGAWANQERWVSALDVVFAANMQLMHRSLMLHA